MKCFFYHSGEEKAVVGMPRLRELPIRTRAQKKAIGPLSILPQLSHWRGQLHFAKSRPIHA